MRTKTEIEWALEHYCWKRKATGHYVLWGEYIVDEKEIMAEVKKEKSKWRYCLWTWGAREPRALEYSWQTFGTAKEVKKAVIELIEAGEPDVRK